MPLNPCSGAKTQLISILFLQPEWSRREKVMPMIVNYALENPKWKVSLQTHKYLNIP
jgi:organic radical activating enzyme